MSQSALDKKILDTGFQLNLRPLDPNKIQNAHISLPEGIALLLGVDSRKIGGPDRQGSSVHVTRFVPPALLRPLSALLPRCSRCCQSSPFWGAKGGAESTE